MDNVPQEKVKEMFSCFLEGHGVLKQFIKNHNNYRNDSIKSVSELRSISGATIDASFCWADTPEDHNFWSQLNAEWFSIWEGYEHSQF